MNKNNKRSFWALIVSQFFGAFNDNVLKILAALLVIKWVEDPIVENNWKTVSMVVVGAPFILFSLVAGRMADKWRAFQKSKNWPL
jgi:MFS family permease